MHGGVEPIMQVWVNPDGATPPPTAQLQAVFDKWKTFEKLMVDKVSETYGSDDWEAMWQAIVETYSRTAFRDFVKAPAIEHWDPENPETSVGWR